MNPERALKLNPNLQPFPIDLAWSQIQAQLESNANLVLVAQPGTGKTTRFPPRLAAWLQRPIAVLQPRRVAARASAQRIASEHDWVVGSNEIGYQVRFERRLKQDTMIQFFTEALLLQKMQIDPLLSQFSAVLLDEFHERSLNLDIAIGALRELQELQRPDLRIIIMSATIDATPVSQFLGGCPIVQIPGSLFPIREIWYPHPLSLDSRAICQRVIETLESIVKFKSESTGDILIFLPGKSEILFVRRGLEKIGNHWSVCELFGQMRLEDQNQVLLGHQPGKQRIILATNIAETSLTLDGVGTVIDSGVARQSSINRFGFSSLQLKRISKSSIRQRMGRAGRQQPGICYHLWNQLDSASFPELETAEVHRSDLVQEVLLLAGMGITHPETFSWFEKPESTVLTNAQASLRDFQFLQPSGKLSKRGQLAARMPIEPRMAALVLNGVDMGCPRLACEIAIALSVMPANYLGDKSSSPKHPSDHAFPAGTSDVEGRIFWLNQNRQDSRAKSWRMQVQDLLRSIEPSAEGTKDIDGNLTQILLRSFAKMVARKREPDSFIYRMVGGFGLNLSPRSQAKDSEFILVLDVADASGGDPVITCAHAISLQDIVDQIRPTQNLIFDRDDEAVYLERYKSYYDLPVSKSQREPAPANQAHDLLIHYCQENWSSLFARSPEIVRWVQRWKWLSSSDSEIPAWPDEKIPWSEIPHDLRSLFEGIMTTAIFNRSSIPDALVFAEVWKNQIPRNIKSKLDQLAPDSLVSPNGKTIAISYQNESGPYAEIRLQNALGWKDSPRIGISQIPLTLHLLAPNGRVAQITNDLRRFWTSSYQEVRKELRGRYPKHAWPENPLEYQPSPRKT